MEHNKCDRLSTQESRVYLGLPVAPPSKDLSDCIVSSSADSADVAGGQGSRTSKSFSRDTKSTTADVYHAPTYNANKTRTGWDVTPFPSPPPPLPSSYNINANNDNVVIPPLASYGMSRERGVVVGGGEGERLIRNGNNSGRGVGEGGGRALPPGTDPFWAPVTAAERTIDTSSDRRPYRTRRQGSNGLGRGGEGGDSGGGGGMGIDRPALRGQEYRREKRRGRAHQSLIMRSSHSVYSPSSSGRGVGRSGVVGVVGDGDAGGQSTGTDNRWRFLGIRWPPLLPGVRRGRSTSAESSSREAEKFGSVKGSLDNKEVFGVVGAWAGKDVERVPDWAARGLYDVSGIGDGGERLGVRIEGTTELGKGLGGHTAYRIKVTDRAIGEQWTVLRRFRQFEALHRDLIPVLSRQPDAAAYALPPKELVGGRHGGVVAKRLKLLKVYLDRLVTCSAAVEHRAMSSFLELDPSLRGVGAYARQHGTDCVIKEGHLRVKEWKGPYKPVINILEAGLRLIGWVSAYVIVSPGPVFLVYRGPEDDPEKPMWALPDRRTIGSQVRVRRVDLWRSDLEKDKTRFFLVSWENTSLLCQVDSEAALESWAQAVDEDVDLRPQQSEQERAKVDIELKAKEEWSTREEGLWGGL